MKKELDTFLMSDGASGIVHGSILDMTPIGYPPGTKIRYKDRLLYDADKMIRDADMRVFLTILKAYTDNKFTAIQSKKHDDLQVITDKNRMDFTTFRVDTGDISRTVYGQRRPTRLLQAMKNMMGLTIHLLDDELGSRGFVRIVPGVVLSEDRKTLSVSLNTEFLKDMAKRMMSYNFDKMIGYKDGDFRLYLVMQGKKFKKNGKYGYHAVSNEELKVALNLHNKNAEAEIAKRFKNIGVNFELDRKGKWFYSKHKKEVENDL